MAEPISCITNPSALPVSLGTYQIVSFNCEMICLTLSHIVSALDEYVYKIEKAKEIREKYNLSYTFIHDLVFKTTNKYVPRATIHRILTRSINTYHADYENAVCPLFVALDKYDKDNRDITSETTIQALRKVIENKDIVIEEKTKAITILQMQIERKDKEIDRLLKIIERMEDKI